MLTCPVREVAIIHEMIVAFKNELEMTDNSDYNITDDKYQELVNNIGNIIGDCGAKEELLEKYSELTKYDNISVLNKMLLGRRARINKFVAEYMDSTYKDTTANSDHLFVVKLKSMLQTDVVNLNSDLVNFSKQIIPSAVEKIEQFVNENINGNNKLEGGAKASKQKCAWTSTGRKVRVKTPRGMVMKTMYKSTTGKLCVRKLSKHSDGTNKVSYVKF